MGHGNCRVDYVQNEEKVETGEWFYTSGDDRIFPKGMPAGQVTAARPGNPFQEISVDPAGLASGLEEVLIVVQGVHQEIPDLKTASQAVYVGQPPPASPGDSQPASAQDASNPSTNGAPALATDADKIREHYKDVADAQNHKFGDNPPGSKPLDFNYQLKPAEKPPAPRPPAVTPNPTAKKPAAPAAQPPAAAPPKPDDQ